MSFFSRLEARAAALDTLLCVGLDPHSADLPAGANTPEGAHAFCAALIAATAPFAAAFKPNAAFFEAFGAPGVAVLARVCALVKATGALCLLDCKRGDISTTAEAYAEAAFGALGAEGVTVNGYMGLDSVAPFAKDPAHGVFVLCKTSNGSAGEVQALRLAGGGRVFEAVARLAAGPAWNAHGNVGLVVGATDPEALAAARAAAPAAWVLAPGVGAQGGDLAAAVAAGLRADGAGLLFPVSRGVSRAADPAAAAAELRDGINAARRGALAARAAAAAAAAAAGAPPAPHAAAFLHAALAAGVLRFGTFTLKSGRVSPFFFNAGNFNTGAALAALGATYAAAIAAPDTPPFDVLFGPAYKGIPLATAAAAALAEKHGRDVGLAYNRKEAKDHGEGGAMVGADVAGKRVLVVDDVISAGTAVGEAIATVRAAGGTVVGVVVGLDRQEKGTTADEPRSAVQAVMAEHGVPVKAVATLGQLLQLLETNAATGEAVKGVHPDELPALLAKVREYRAAWGV
jgi:uridine monophosphate synthetase